MLITARKFVCRRADCPRRVFCERLPELTAPHAHTTGELADAHRHLGLALGGEAGARLAAALGLPTSPDATLRRVKDAPDEPTPRPRYVGIDDRATRKGHSYGTILIDLERGTVIDLLPGRDGESVEVWLAANPQVEVITRDRWPAYIQAATTAAPQAKQVADRFHLLRSCSATARPRPARPPPSGTPFSPVAPGGRPKGANRSPPGSARPTSSCGCPRSPACRRGLTRRCSAGMTPASRPSGSRTRTRCGPRR